MCRSIHNLKTFQFYPNWNLKVYRIYRILLLVIFIFKITIILYSIYSIGDTELSLEKLNWHYFIAAIGNPLLRIVQIELGSSWRKVSILQFHLPTTQLTEWYQFYRLWRGCHRWEQPRRDSETNAGVRTSTDHRSGDVRKRSGVYRHAERIDETRVDPFLHGDPRARRQR